MYTSMLLVVDSLLHAFFFSLPNLCKDFLNMAESIRYEYSHKG